MESVNDVQFKQCAWIEYLVTKKESVTKVHRYLCNAYGSAVFNRSTVDCWVKRMTASEKGRQSSMFCLADVFAQLLVLKCCGMLMPLFPGIDASHVNKLQSFFQSAKEVLVT